MSGEIDPHATPDIVHGISELGIVSPDLYARLIGSKSIADAYIIPDNVEPGND